MSILNLLPHIDRVDRWTRYRKKKKKKKKREEDAAPLLLLKDLPSKMNASARSVKSTSSYAEIHLGIRTPRSETRSETRTKTLDNAIVVRRHTATPMKRLIFDDDDDDESFNKSTILRVRSVDENRITKRIPKSVMKAKRRISLQSMGHRNRLREIFEKTDRSSTGLLPMDTVVNILCRHVSGMTRDGAEDLCSVHSDEDDFIRYSNVLTREQGNNNTTTVKKKKKLHTERRTKKMSQEKLCVLRNKLRAAAYVGTKGKNFRVLFERFDKDHNGYLNRSEFEHALRKRVRLSRMELNALWNIVDRDGSGSVDLEEFQDL